MERKIENFKREEVLGIPFVVSTAEEVSDFCRDIISRKTADNCLTIYTPNPEIVVKAQSSEDYMRVLRRAGLLVPDGIGILYGSKLKGGAIRNRITGIGLLEKLLEYTAEAGGSVYLLGSKPAEKAVSAEGNAVKDKKTFEETLGVAERAACNIKAKYPDTTIAGTHHGYFSTAEESDVVAAAANARPDLLVVALGAPKQEFFIDKYADEIGARIAIGVGGALDVWAGNVSRAPRWISALGMEWLYRALKEPSRFRRLTAIPVFLSKVIASK